MIVHDSATATALRSHPQVARAISMFPKVTKAVVAVGAWEPGASTIYDAITPAERKVLLRLGVRAEVSGVLLDADGAVVEAPLTGRMICIGAAELRSVPEVIALVYGAGKASAARAAIRGGCVNGLVTHTSMARALLSMA
jgi:DNA-binding transcriptional regulator LsrR (DeoR family)